MIVTVVKIHFLKAFIFSLAHREIAMTAPIISPTVSQ